MASLIYSASYLIHVDFNPRSEIAVNDPRYTLMIVPQVITNVIIISLSTTFEFLVNSTSCVLQWNTCLLVLGKKKLDINVREIKT